VPNDDDDDFIVLWCGVMSLIEGVTLNSDFQNIITERLKFKTENSELSQPVRNTSSSPVWLRVNL
jgi:hypothetical protein